MLVNKKASQDGTARIFFFFFIPQRALRGVLSRGADRREKQKSEKVFGLSSQTGYSAASHARPFVRDVFVTYDLGVSKLDFGGWSSCGFSAWPSVNPASVSHRLPTSVILYL